MPIPYGNSVTFRLKGVQGAIQRITRGCGRAFEERLKREIEAKVKEYLAETQDDELVQNAPEMTISLAFQYDVGPIEVRPNYRARRQ